MAFTENDMIAWKQWVGDNGFGVNDRSEATAYHTNTNVAFKCNNRNRSSAQAYEIPQLRLVRNLRVESIISTNQKRRKVTIAWDSPYPSDPDEKYFFKLNNDKDFMFSDKNIRRKIPNSSTMISKELSGDDIQFFFYVAVTNRNGSLYGTKSINFSIDTIAPVIHDISLPETVSEKNITMNFDVIGASEIYISNIDYGVAGNWEHFIPQKLWEISCTEENNSIYFLFKDRSGNISKYNVTVLCNTDTFEKPNLSDLIILLKIMSGYDPFGDIEASQLNEVVSTQTDYLRNKYFSNLYDAIDTYNIIIGGNNPLLNIIDVNKDERINLSEVIYIIKLLADF